MSTREKMHEEAIERMKMLGMRPDIIEAFEKQDKIIVSVGDSKLYVANENLLAQIRNFEQNYNACVFYGIYNETEIGTLYYLLYVSNDEDGWKEERILIKGCSSIAYFLFDGYPEFSQLECIDMKLVEGIPLSKS